MTKSEDQLRCFVCKATVPPRPENKAYPFCSARCQTIDLGSWLSGDYRIPEDAKAVDESDSEHESTGEHETARPPER